MKQIIIFISVFLLTGCSHHLSMDSSSLDLIIELEETGNIDPKKEWKE